MPVMAITDATSDIGIIAERSGFGIWCLYGDRKAALRQMSILTNNVDLRNQMGRIGFSFMKKRYDVKNSYNKIINSINHLSVK